MLGGAASGEDVGGSIPPRVSGHFVRVLRMRVWGGLNFYIRYPLVVLELMIMATANKSTASKGEIKDGVYVEENVELRNGVKVTVEVILDPDDLPSTFGSLLAEGNGPALAIAQCTTRTRRVLDLAGATMADLKGAVGDVVQRAQDAKPEA